MNLSTVRTLAEIGLKPTVTNRDMLTIDRRIVLRQCPVLRSGG